MSDSWAAPMAKALLDMGMKRARIGVVGLKPGQLAHVGAVDGVVNYTAYAGVTAQLPDASFDDATNILGAARYVKSDEQIACLRRAAEMAAAALQSLVGDARPGIPTAALYARGMGRLLELGGEYFPLTLQLDAPDGVRYRDRRPEPGRTLDTGWVIEAEVNAVWG